MRKRSIAFRVSEEEWEILQKKADKYAEGNLTKYLQLMALYSEISLVNGVGLLKGSIKGEDEESNDLYKTK